MTKQTHQQKRLHAKMIMLSYIAARHVFIPRVKRSFTYRHQKFAMRIDIQGDFWPWEKPNISTAELNNFVYHGEPGNHNLRYDLPEEVKNKL